MPSLPAAPAEGQKSIMSFFKKVVDHKAVAGPKEGKAGLEDEKQSAGKGSSIAGALDASAASSAATPPLSSARRKAPPPAAEQPSIGVRAAAHTRARKGASGRNAAAALREAQGGAASRPSRASKQRARGQLKERDYSSDSLMEDSEESAGEAEEEAAQQTLDCSADLAAETPASASSMRITRKVRFSIPSDDGTAVEEAMGGTISPIAVDDEEVLCMGDEIGTGNNDAKRELRLRASLEAVEGELGSLQYGKRVGKRDLSSCDADGECAGADPAHRKRHAGVPETPKVPTCVRPEPVRALVCVRCCACLHQLGKPRYECT
jgi:hypothetical protein